MLVMQEPAPQVLVDAQCFDKMLCNVLTDIEHLCRHVAEHDQIIKSVCRMAFSE